MPVVDRLCLFLLVDRASSSRNTSPTVEGSISPFLSKIYCAEQRKYSEKKGKKNCNKQLNPMGIHLRIAV